MKERGGCPARTIEVVVHRMMTTDRKEKAVHKYPVALLEFGEADPEFSHVDGRGRSPRFSVELVDGDRFYFPSAADAERFMALHGLAGVSDEEMEEARKAGGHS